MNNKIEVCLSDDDVISILNIKDKAFYNYPMFKIIQFILSMESFLKNSFGETIVKKWLNEGIDSELLKVGAKSWQKGKIKLRFNLEFIPDEPELEETSTNETVEIDLVTSSLDEIRQKIKQTN